MTPPATTPTGAHASERDQLLAAAIKFIADLTGMKPPPIEVAPADVFAPFHSFVDEVQGIVGASRGAPVMPGACPKPEVPVIFVDGQGKLVSRVSAEQVESVLGPVVDEIRTSMARQSGSATHYAGEGPISALYGIRYFAATLAEAQAIAGDAMDTARQRTAAARQAEPASQAAVQPNEPLWDRKGNVIHAAVDRLGAAQRAAATPVATSVPVPAGMAAPGTWVCNGNQVAKVREAHAPDKYETAGAYDLVLYARDGERVGRESPAMGGPRGYEPFCSAKLWRAIEAPRFPLPRYGNLEGHVRFTAPREGLPEAEAARAADPEHGDQDADRETPRP